jgi:hypothetical protein
MSFGFAGMVGIFFGFSLLLIVRRNKIGPIFLIAISIVNRVISDFFFIGGAHLIFITWTVILVIFSILDYRKLTKQTKT